MGIFKHSKSIMPKYIINVSYLWNNPITPKAGIMPAFGCFRYPFQC